MTDAIKLTNAERMELTRRANSRTDRAEDARRARLILLLAEGHTWDEVSERIECSRGFVASWNKRFVEQRIAGLYSRHLGQVASVLTPELEARILEATRRAPGDGSTHWSTRKLGTHLDVSHMTVAQGLGQARNQAASARTLHGSPTIRTSRPRPPISSACI